MIHLELLAPAKDLATGIAAIDCGADAIYIGAAHHGARAAAGNPVDDIKTLCQYAHRFRVKIYVTLNTIIYDSEIEEVRKLVNELYAAGVDALIVQDMALLEMKTAPISLHASTQCDIRTPEKALFLEKAGFDQLVLPREFSLEQIRKVREVTTVPLEAFVHGALCVSYSGDCRASFVNGGRSANRGECAQICRLPYNLIDGDGNVVVENRHLLSLKDLNRLVYLRQLIDAGVSSFKIEGRLKSVEYVRNVTAAYSEGLNRIVASDPEKYARASCGTAEPGFTPQLDKSFNRGFTSFFISDTQPGAGKLGSHLTPKYVGEVVAKVVDATPRKISITRSADLANGDGLAFFDKKGNFHGFRINRVDSGNVYLSAPLNPLPEKGTVLYRNFDKNFNDNLEKNGGSRYLTVSACLELNGNGISLTLSDCRGCRVKVFMECTTDAARNPQKEFRKSIISKTGGTVYRIEEVIDNIPDHILIKASVLSELRRRAISALDSANNATYPLSLRKLPDADFSYPETRLDMHGNVANSLAEAFYKKHGVKDISPAVEVAREPSSTEEIRVMTSRYCLRRELGACLKTQGAGKLKGPLTLVSRNGSTLPMRLDFDCANCQMHVTAKPRFV